jgi:hypothetical protein
MPKRITFLDMIVFVLAALAVATLAVDLWLAIIWFHS